MKKVILISLSLFFSTLLTAQITLENTYSNAFSFPFVQFNRDFGLVNLGGSNYKYYLVDNDSSTLTLYNLNHTVYKNITIPVAGVAYHVSYISNSLFDCDSSNVEYLLTKGGAVAPYYTRVYDETGTTLFTANNAIVTSCKWNCPNTMTTIVDKPFIYNTPNGTKMILTYTDGSARVWSLCGTLAVTSIRDLDNLNEALLFDAYPNPSSNNTRIDYNLPEGVNEGEISIFNTQGQLIKKYKVDKQFNFINISTEELGSGTYYYNLRTSLGTTKGKKMIKID